MLEGQSKAVNIWTFAKLFFKKRKNLPFGVGTHSLVTWAIKA